MSDKYTTNTPSLKATIGKFRKIDTDKLTIKGQAISELISELISSGSGLKFPDDYPKFITRMTVEEDDCYYMLFTDEGKFVYCSFLDKIVNGTGLFKDVHVENFEGDMPNLVNGQNMFALTKIKQFKGDMPNLVNGQNMFRNCLELTTFDSDLSSLEDGTNMFTSSYLTKETILGILNNLKNKNKALPNETGYTLTLSAGDEVRNDEDILNFLGVEADWETVQLVTNNGATWNITLNSAGR